MVDICGQSQLTGEMVRNLRLIALSLHNLVMTRAGALMIFCRNPVFRVHEPLTAMESPSSMPRLREHRDFPVWDEKSNCFDHLLTRLQTQRRTDQAFPSRYEVTMELVSEFLIILRTSKSFLRDPLPDFSLRLKCATQTRTSRSE